jgi:Holliday junction DNA helicase RuvB
MKEQVTTPKPSPEEERTELTLRPKTLQEFVGQDRLKRNFKVFIKAAQQRKQPLDHCLFYGPPGLGKTTLAHIIARELNVNLRSTGGPILERVGDLAAILTSLSEGDVLFIDEIHRLNHMVEEALYPVMEEFELDVIIGQGPSAKTIKIPTAKFTLIGATTRAGLLTSPLRERFSISEHLIFYNEEELKKIVLRSSKILNITITDESAVEIAKRARGTPRIANRLLYRVRDFADVKSDGTIDIKIVEETMSHLEVDSMGLDSMDRQILLAIIEKFSGGPVGIETLATAVSEEIDTLTDVYEPYLIKSGFLARTPRGRVTTPNAYDHLGIPKPKQKNLGF